MDLAEYFARKLFVRAVDWLSKYEMIKTKGVNEVYCMQINKINKMKKEIGCVENNQIN